MACYRLQNYLLTSVNPSLIYAFNLLKPTGHVMHQEVNIQQLYALPTLYLCVLYLSFFCTLLFISNQNQIIYNTYKIHSSVSQ
jgi:hypothetical protein